MEKKKILYLITKATWGGAQRYVYDLATNLPSGFEPVAAFGESGRLQQLLDKAKIRTYKIPSLGRDIAFLSDISSFFQILVCVWRVRPDVIHLNSSKAAALGALAARILFVPKIVFTIHGWPFKEKRNIFSAILIRFVSWLTAILSHEIIVVSKTDEIIGVKMMGLKKKNKVHYIPLGIEKINFLPPSEALRALVAPLPENISNWPRIVTIAELTPNKGICFAIKAIAELKRRGEDVTYNLIGTGEQQKELWELAQQLDVIDRVRFLNFQQNAAMYLQGFDAFLLPSIKEGMPYVLLEAASAQLPIITTDVVDPNFLNMSFDGLVIKPGDATAIADAISTVLKAPRERSRLVSSLDSMVKETIALY